jgi:hypothetical protein
MLRRVSAKRSLPMQTRTESLAGREGLTRPAVQSDLGLLLLADNFLS